MNKYFINNRLQMNVKKTIVMIISKNKEEKEDKIEVNGEVIKHNRTIKILGTTMNENLDWNSHLNEGNSSLISQLKQRLNSLKIIAKIVSQKFARQLANAILISKLNYNIGVWGNTSNTNTQILQIQ